MIYLFINFKEIENFPTFTIEQFILDIISIYRKIIYTRAVLLYPPSISSWINRDELFNRSDDQ